MPLIDFKCEACGHQFFEIVKNSEEKVACPKCKNDKTHKVYKGKYYGKGSCSGSCAGCKGCH